MVSHAQLVQFNFFVQVVYLWVALFPPALVTDACSEIKTKLLAIQREAATSSDQLDKSDDNPNADEKTPSTQDIPTKVAAIIAYYDQVEPSYQIFEHFTLSYANIKTATAAFATVIATILQLQQ